MTRPRLIAFDALGTLLDVTSVAARCEIAFPGHGEVLASMWRERQLRYTWLRALMGRYADFEQVTRDALEASCLALGLDPRAEGARGLPDAYFRLPLYPDVCAVLGPRMRRLPARHPLERHTAPGEADDGEGGAHPQLRGRSGPWTAPTTSNREDEPPCGRRSSLGATAY